MSDLSPHPLRARVVLIAERSTREPTTEEIVRIRHFADRFLAELKVLPYGVHYVRAVGEVMYMSTVPLYPNGEQV